MSQLIESTLDNGIWTITLNRPEKFNSINKTMAMSFQDALDLGMNNEQVRVLLIRANGKAFCAGQDLSEAIDPSGPGIEKIVAEHYNPIVRKIRHGKKPVVGLVQGVAAGAGANIALACDLVIAGESGSFIQAFSKIGLIPDSGGTFMLPRLIGWQRAAALCFLGDKVSGKEAADMGMIYKVVSDEALESEGLNLAQRLAAMPTMALGYTKHLLNEAANHGLDEQLELEKEYQVHAAQTKDHQEGVLAFLEKRNPVFKGN